MARKKPAPATTETPAAVPDLAVTLAPVAWAAVEAWSSQQGIDCAAWSAMEAPERLVWASQARMVIDSPAHRPVFEGDRWEETVRAKLFAAVVEAIAR